MVVESDKHAAMNRHDMGMIFPALAAAICVPTFLVAADKASLPPTDSKSVG